MSRRKKTTAARPASKSTGDKARFMTLDQTCEYGGFSRTKAYALIKEGKFSAKKLGTRTLVDRASFDRFLDTLPRIA